VPQPSSHLRAVGGEIEYVTAQVRQIADAVGLRNHTFEVTTASLGPGIHATCDCVPGRAYSTIRLDDGFFELPPGDQREVLIHETLHPLLHPLMGHVVDLRSELGRAHYETVERVFRRDLEVVVDTLTTALVRLL
jgi:hypothetical protein